MGGMLLVGLFLELCALVVEVWPLLIAILGLWLLCQLVILPSRQAQTREVRDRLRHAQARREIDRIALEARRAMYDAVLRHADVTPGTAVEVKPK